MLTLYKNKKNITKEKLIELIEVGCRSGINAAKGEIEDINFKIDDIDKISIKRYIDMVKYKTGALIEAATEAGAVIGGGTEEERKSLKQYGRYLGIAFQIYDDAKDLLASESVSLKSRHSDIRQVRLTPQLIYAYHRGTLQDKNIIKKIMKKKKREDEDIEKILEIYRRTEAIRFNQRLAEIFLKRVKQSIKKIRKNKATELLLRIAEIMEYWTFLEN